MKKTFSPASSSRFYREENTQVSPFFTTVGLLAVQFRRNAEDAAAVLSKAIRE
jgi:hypothetical protein